MFRLPKLVRPLAALRTLLVLSPLFLLPAAAAGAGAGAAFLPQHGLALLPNGQMAGWGANGFGEVQAGQGDFLQAPHLISLPGTRAMAAVVGSRHSLAIDENGRVWGWGDNSSGQLGLGHTKPVAGMALIQGLPARASFIAAGAQHSVVLLTDGTVWVWGANNRGQIGQGVVDAFAVQTSPVRMTMPGRVVDVAAGNDFVMALIGQRDKSGGAQGGVWLWGAGNGEPHPMEGLQSAVVVRAAGDVAMARTTTGGYWQWQPEQTAPGIAQRAVFDKLGEMAHPLLAALKAASTTAVASSSVTTLPLVMTAAAPTRVALAPSATVSPVPAVSSVMSPKPASLTARPEVTQPAGMTAAVSAVPPASVVVMPAPLVVRTTPAAATLSLSGTVRLSGGFGADGTGKLLENVRVVADGAQCSATDGQGHYLCSVPAGWSGRVMLQRANYRFSPSALSFQNLRTDAGQQDFAAIYDPR